MVSALYGAIVLGLLYALMALGVYITFRILDFPDLTVDGSFVTGAAVALVMITQGYSPLLATLCSFAAGLLAGTLTGLLHTKGKINGLLAGILMMLALYSINMRIMGKPNLSVLNIETLLTPIAKPIGLYIAVLAVCVLVIKLLLDAFFHTDLGLALRATGDNERMIRSLGANTDTTKIIGISLSNGLVALSGALIAQHGGAADVNMGVGMIVIGLASVIIGEALLGTRNIVIATLAVVIGSVLYRIIIAFALRVTFLDASDLKLITSIIVIIALLVPYMRRLFKQKAAARKRSEELLSMMAQDKGGREI